MVGRQVLDVDSHVATPRGIPIDPLIRVRHQATAVGVDVEALYRTQRARLVGLATAITMDRHLAEEVVQDAFVGLQRHALGVDQPLGYLQRSVVNHAISVVRRRRVAAGHIAATLRPASLPEIDETWGNRWELFVGCAPDLAEGIRSRHQLAAKPEERLWGPEGAENLEFDAASAYECNEYAFINDENEPRIMEEWTCTPLGEFVRPNVEHLIENLVERMADDVLLEDAWDSIEKMRLERDAEVVAAFEAAVAVLRSKLNTAGYRMADKLVAKHTITWVDEEPYMDGEPMYVKREETQP